jgi:hypothetical protein
MSQLILKIAIEDGYVAAHDRVWRRLIVYIGNEDGSHKEALCLELEGIKDTRELAAQLHELAMELEDSR